MESFAAWLEKHTKGRPVFVSDNVAFDWQFINYYFHRFLDATHSVSPAAESVISTLAGQGRVQATEWKKYRVTAHTHNPVDDARGNAEALKKLRNWA